MTKKHETLLGAHMSIAGGLENAIITGANIGCTAVQFFTHNNRQWQAKPLHSDAIQVFQQALRDNPLIKKTVVHASYLINIGSPEPEVRIKSLHALQDEFDRCQKLGVDAVVFHPGARIASSEEECLKQIAQGIEKVLEKATGKTKLVVENTAGQGSVVGYTFEQLAYIQSLVSTQAREHLGFCFDTCHAFAAGYDFKTSTSYKHMWERFDKLIGLKNLSVIHLNDSKKGLGSRVDRHEHIGKGELGLEAFNLIMNDERFFATPKILETPKENDCTEDIENMKILRNLIR